MIRPPAVNSPDKREGLQKERERGQFQLLAFLPYFPLGGGGKKGSRTVQCRKKILLFLQPSLLSPATSSLPATAAAAKRTVFLPFPLPPTRPTPHFDYNKAKKEKPKPAHTLLSSPLPRDVNAIKHNVVPRRIWEIMEGWLLYLPPLFPPLGTRSSHRSTENFFSSSFLLLETEERKLLSSEVGWCLKDREERKRRENTPFVFTYPRFPSSSPYHIIFFSSFSGKRAVGVFLP